MKSARATDTQIVRISKVNNIEQNGLTIDI